MEYDLGLDLGDMRKRGGDELADDAELILGAMSKARDNDGNAVRWRRMRTFDLKDRSRSMWDEYDNGAMERADRFSLAWATNLNPRGYCRSAFFANTAVEARERLTLENHRGHVQRNAPEFGWTNFAAGIQLLMDMIADDYDMPEISDLARAPLPELETRGFIRRRTNVVGRPRPIALPEPAFCITKGDGIPLVPGMIEEEAEEAAVEMMVRSSYAGIFHKLVFVANRGHTAEEHRQYERGKRFFKRLDNLAQTDPRMHVDNVDAIFFGDGLQTMTPDWFGTEMSREVPEWLEAGVTKGVLLPA